MLTADLGDLTEDLHKWRTTLFAIILTFSIVALVAGFCGCFACSMEMFEPMCYTICYGIVLFFVWVAMITTGAVTMNVALSGAQRVDTYCETGVVASDKGWDRVTARIDWVE